MRFKYSLKGVCSRQIEFDLENGVVDNVIFSGGCPGNTQGVAALANGSRAEDIISRVKGIHCGFKPTSCPDQLAMALEKALLATQEENDLDIKLQSDR